MPTKDNLFISSLTDRTTGDSVTIVEIYNLLASGGTNNNIYNFSGEITGNRVLTIGDSTSLTILDGRATIDAAGIEYSADYSSGFSARSLVDKDYVDSIPDSSIYNNDGNISEDRVLTLDTYSSLTIQDDRGTKIGLAYASDYSADFVHRSLVDKDYVDNKFDISIYSSDGDIHQDRIVNIRTSASLTINDQRTTPIGITYSADYSDNFTSRSLVDKDYSDNFLASKILSDLAKYPTPSEDTYVISWDEGIGEYNLVEQAAVSSNKTLYSDDDQVSDIDRAANFHDSTGNGVGSLQLTGTKGASTTILLTSLEVVSGVATGTSADRNHYEIGDEIIISGADVTEANGTQIVTADTNYTFSFSITAVDGFIGGTITSTIGYGTGGAIFLSGSNDGASGNVDLGAFGADDVIVRIGASDTINAGESYAKATAIVSRPNVITMYYVEDGGSGSFPPTKTFSVSDIGFRFTDNSGLGCAYAGDYSDSNQTGDRWITDKGYDDKHLGSKELQAVMLDPQPTNDGDAVVWNETEEKYDLSDIPTIFDTSGTFEDSNRNVSLEDVTGDKNYTFELGAQSTASASRSSIEFTDKTITLKADPNYGGSGNELHLTLSHDSDNETDLAKFFNTIDGYGIKYDGSITNFDGKTLISQDRGDGRYLAIDDEKNIFDDNGITDLNSGNRVWTLNNSSLGSKNLVFRVNQNTGAPNDYASEFLLSDTLLEFVITDKSNTVPDTELGLRLKTDSGNLGIQVTDSIYERGLNYADDYSVNGKNEIGNRWIPDAGYTDYHLGGEPVGSFLKSPTTATDNKIVAWVTTEGEYDLVELTTCYTPILQSSSGTTSITLTDTVEYQLVFAGTNQTSTDNLISIDTAGNITCLVGGCYSFRMFANAESSGGSNSTLYFGVFINDVQFNGTFQSTFATNGASTTTNETVPLNLAATDVVKIKCLPDGGNMQLNYHDPATLGWTISPAMYLGIDKVTAEQF